jgi:hypothetical protein
VLADARSLKCIRQHRKRSSHKKGAVRVLQGTSTRTKVHYATTHRIMEVREANFENYLVQSGVLCRQRVENNETLHVEDTKESVKLESMPPETAAVAPRPQVPAATQSAHHGLQALAAAATDAAAVDAEREAAAVASARSQTAAPAATVRPAAVTGPARHATAAATAPVARANPLQIRIPERVTPAALIRRAIVKQEVVTKAEAAVAVKVEPSSATTVLLPSQQVFQHVDILSHIYTFIGPR